jgi:small subunit ribosomal protein S17
MAEDEKIENGEETPEAAAGEVAGSEATAEPKAAAEPEPDGLSAEPEPAGLSVEPDAAIAGRPAEPAEVVEPKERRRRARSVKAAKARPRPPRTPEERHAERLAERGVKAQARRARRQRERAKAATETSAAQATPPREHAPGKQKTRQGVVVSDRADKTITVRIDVTRRHPRYEKIVRTSSTLHAHDERNDAHTGDTVVVRESRPLSRSKRWRLVEVLERAK